MIRQTRDLAYYGMLWPTCAILPDRKPLVRRALVRVLENEAEYRQAEQLTGVPWLLIGALHYREANCNQKRGLHNGEPWSRKTTLVPKGRGPFSCWLDAAHDALVQARLANRPAGYWSIPVMLRAAEQYNGWGYAFRGKPSPYVWNWTNHGVGAGYFVADGKYDADAVNRQAGVAAILKMAEE